MKIDPAAVDAVIMSHGHYDHCGGLTGFLEAQRPKLKKDLRLYTGGEDAFCHRTLRASDGSFSDYGPMIDRRRIKALGVEIVQSEAPIVIEGQAFTTGAVPRTSIERVLPNSWVEFGVKDGLGCDPKSYANHHFTEEELSGKPQPDGGTQVDQASLEGGRVMPDRLARRSFIAAMLVLGALPARAAEKPKVIATFSVLGDMVARVAGDKVQLTTIVGGDADCELYQPTNADARAVADARLFVMNGLNPRFEPWAEPLLKRAAFRGTRLVVSQGANVIIE